MTTTTTTPARDRLAANHQKAGDLRGRIADLWATAESGGEVDPAAITAAEAEVAVADRLTAVLQRAAQAEVVAEQNATWQGIETDALAKHRELAANFHDALDAARAAVAALASSAEALHAHLAAFTGDPRRPPKLGADGTPQQLLGGWERATVSGVTMRAPTGVDTVLSVASEQVEHLTGGRGDSPVVQQLGRIRAATTFPADNRK